VPLALRSLALGGAGVLASLALLGQSRGWLLTLPPALILFVALSPGRLRALCAVLAVAATTAVVSGRLLAVHDDFSAARLDALVAGALAATLTCAAVLALVGAAVALADRRRAPHADAHAERHPATAGRRRVRIALAAAAVAAVAAGVAIGGGTLSGAWQDFKEGGQPEAGSSRFTSVGTYRYDFWRVAWELFEEEPLKGIGVENFQEGYLRTGSSFEQPRYAHSLELGVLSQTGLVGAGLLFGALGCALWAGFARRRGTRGALAWVSAGTLGMFAYWLLHASVDWLWEFPAVGGLAFAALGLACAPAAGRAAARRRRLPAAGVALATVAAALVAVVLAGPWLAERETRRALDGWRASPAGSFDRLDRAAGLNPLSARPHTVAGTIAVELGQLDRARAAFREALAIEPANAYALLELGAIAAERGDRRRALALLRRARGLRPRDEAVRYALARVLRAQPVSVSAVNQRILEQARGRVQRAP
jgi:O-antigen ligase